MIAVAPPVERPLLGVALRCVTATTFALMAALLKYASDHGATLVDLMFYRSIGGLPVVAAFALTQGGVDAIKTRQPMKQATRSGIGFVAMILTFGALTLLPIAEATTLTYSAPIITTIFSALFLREAVGPRRWLAVLAGFIGVVLVARPGGAPSSTLGLAFGLCASVGQAAVAITLRQIGKTESPSATVFWFMLSATIGAGLALPWLGARHDLMLTLVLLGGGVFGGIGQLATTASVRYAPVSMVVPFDYLQIIWATLIGWFIFADVPTAMMLAGAALIAGSGIYTAYRESRRGKVPLEGDAVPAA